MFEEIGLNFKKLIALYEAQKERSEYLSLELEKSKEANQTLEKQIADLKSQIDRLKLSGAFSTPQGLREARERIDTLIREVDKCISLLEN